MGVYMDMMLDKVLEGFIRHKIKVYDTKREEVCKSLNTLISEKSDDYPYINWLRGRIHTLEISINDFKNDLDKVVNN